MNEKTTRRKHPVRTGIIAGSAALALLLGGGAWWAADRFLIEHVEIADVSAYEASLAATGEGAEAEPDSATEGVVSGSSYTDGATSVDVTTVTTGTADDTLTYYVAEVTLSDATRLRSAFAKDSFGENIIETPSAIAESVGAVFAINGDYYGFRDTGIVIRNGVVYRDEGAREGLAFYTDGRVEVYDETTTSADELLADGVWNTLSFGPAIVEDGAVVDGIEDVEVDTNPGNHSIQGEQPRTAVGVIDENHLVFVVVDGRSPGYSRGATLPELGEIMAGLGATTAYNLDGGGSSTMYFDGALVNDPLGRGTERGTSDILYLAW
ncbi:phosphodiester glycosidase family protein [Agromyces atrinae]|uniref:Exopolysaccharide biosynthesis protein n=1 Tax=Agromyces atrinae TaxID=592376 RepID=A0A4V1R2J7_9MICO|nr:phosphodiester glycosidase family protein [Agromyces atrinae]NYD66736.1 exopolysaccharide biosynthesis protein [Agromyces atrinae]RXZ87396.1 phosphodiester glycosidase family protein [Agromyces atrinae]